MKGVIIFYDKRIQSLCLQNTVFYSKIHMIIIRIVQHKFHLFLPHNLKFYLSSIRLQTPIFFEMAE